MNIWGFHIYICGLNCYLMGDIYIGRLDVHRWGANRYCWSLHIDLVLDIFQSIGINRELDIRKRIRNSLRIGWTLLLKQCEDVGQSRANLKVCV